MDLADEFLQALNEIENEHNLPRDQWSEAIEAKVRELINTYKTEHPGKAMNK